jgi:hypothetical protein
MEGNGNGERKYGKERNGRKRQGNEMKMKGNQCLSNFNLLGQWSHEILHGKN